MSDVEVGSKRSNDYDEYDDKPSYKKTRADKEKMRFLLAGKCCGSVIGKAGENIKRLRRDYGVLVNLPDVRSSERVLTVSGDKDVCIDVVKEIMTLPKIEAPFSVDAQRKLTFEMNFLAQSDQVGAVIGKGGQTIKDIREESGGKVKVYQECLPNSNERVVAIGGDDEARLMAAFGLVLDVLRDRPRKMQTIYYDPKNKNSDGGPMSNQMQMGGGNDRGNQFAGLGAGLGGLGALGGLSGLAAGAASLLGQLGVGAQSGGGILGASASSISNMWGNNTNSDGILGTGNNSGFLGASNNSGILGTGSSSGFLGAGNNSSFLGAGNNSGILGAGNNRDQARSFGGDQTSGFGMNSMARGQHNDSNSNRDRHNNKSDGYDRDYDRGHDRVHDRGHENFGQMHTVAKVTVSNDMCGAIIGKSGSRIKEIRQATGARVDFTETEKGSKEDRVITISGTQKQTIEAQQMMAQFVENRSR